jgi:hypothetical protein
MSTATAHCSEREQCAPEYATRYETLRAYAIECHVPPSRDGLVILRREGVAAWIRACARLPAPIPRVVPPEQHASTPLPEASSAEVVHILAAMTLSHFPEVHA